LPPPAANPPPGGVALARGLAGYWRFEDGRGSQVARDWSPAGHDCVLHSRDPDDAWVKGAFGGGLRFGPGTWLECPQPAQVVSGGLELSISAWTRRAKLRTFHEAVVARQLGSEKQDFFLLSFFRDQLSFRSDAAHGTYGGSVPEPGERWVHVAVTLHHDGRSRLFVDGVLVGEQRLQQRAVSVDKPLTIGAAVDSKQLGQYLHGEIDEVAYYDRALSDEEIAALAHGAQPL
jgi:hypothetical protein